MKLSKRSLAMIVAIVLCAATAIGGTFAYLQDETEEVANVMTVGNVAITQSETFTQNSPLYPTDNDDKKVTKEITVTNTGKSPAYVRTLVKFEMGTMSEEDFVKYVKWSYNTTDWTQGTPYVEDGKYVVPFIYKDALAVGTTTSASLQKVWLDPSAGNDQVAALANGNGSYTIYALSQAVQTDGFDTAAAALAAAFDGTDGSGSGDSDEPAITPDVTVTNQSELDAALTAATDPTIIELKPGSYALLNVSLNGKNVTFYSASADDVTLDATGIQTNMLQTYGATITFDGVTVKWFEKNSDGTAAHPGYQGFPHTTKVVYKNCKIIGCQFMYATECEFINCTFENYSDYAVYARGLASGTQKVSFTDCTFTTGGKAVMLYNDGPVAIDVELKDCTFTGNGSLATDKAAVETGDDAGAKTSKFNITFNGCSQTGFVANKSTDALWGNKNSILADRLSVTIDGTKVY